MSVFNLLKEATYGFYPQLLAKGNYRSNVYTGAFATYLGAGSSSSDAFVFSGTSAGFGYINGGLKFDGENDIASDTTVNLNSSEFTLFIDVTDNENTGDVAYCNVQSGGNIVTVGRYLSQVRTIQYINSAARDDYNTATFPGRVCATAAFKDLKSYAWRQQFNNFFEYDSETVVTANDQPMQRMVIGNQDASPTRWMNGTIHTLAWFPRKLTDAEVSLLYQQSLLGFPGIYADAYGPNLEYAELKNFGQSRNAQLKFQYKLGRYRRGGYSDS